MKEIVKFNYNGNPIQFENGNSVMINATEMAKSFGKRTSDWLNNAYTKEFLNALTETRKSVSPDFQAVRVVYGNNGGTWLHEDAALEFARWLSPKFAIWCNDRIKELIKTGVATVTNDDEAILNAINILNKRIEESKRKLEIAQNQLASQAPKVEYYDALVDRNGLTNLRDTAKAIGINPKAFVNLLLENRFLYRDRKNTLKPYSQYIDLFELKEWKSNDNKKTGIQTLVNQKGREHFLKYFKK